MAQHGRHGHRLAAARRGLALAAPAVADFYRDPAIVDGVRIVALTLPGTTITDAALSATQEWRSRVEYTLIGRFLDPLTVLGLTGLVVVLGLGLDAALWAVAGGAWLAAVLALVALARRMRTVPAARPVVEARAIFSFSMVRRVSALAATGLIWSGTLILGRLTDPASVGVFTVGTRLVSSRSSSWRPSPTPSPRTWRTSRTPDAPTRRPVPRLGDPLDPRGLAARVRRARHLRRPRCSSSSARSSRSVPR